jgi:formylmethanofuran dehydrogenase subunit E
MIESDAGVLLKRAVDLHGHLGPFLVIGVKMSLLAEKHFKSEGRDKPVANVVVRTRLFPPFSCVIDGIQAATSCTVGNRKMSIEESSREVSACFTSADPKSVLKVSVKRDALENLERQLTNNANAEVLAKATLCTSDDQFFDLEEI